VAISDPAIGSAGDYHSQGSYNYIHISKTNYDRKRKYFLPLCMGTKAEHAPASNDRPGNGKKDLGLTVKLFRNNLG
jgi:hypothetical protein